MEEINNTPKQDSKQTKFIQELTKQYLQNPAATLPNSLWKTFAGLDEFETKMLPADNGGYNLCIEGHGKLMLQTPTNQPLTQADLAKYRFALLHDAQIEGLDLHDFKQIAYFRLTHRHEAIPPVVLPDGFVVSTIDVGAESGEIANFLNQCYPGMKQRPETVLGWQTHPVFHPSLWIWVKEVSTGQPAALGIAEFDPSIKEGSLEWIQVHPDYRRKGLGTVVVNELLGRLAPIANFSMVAGQIDNKTHPEILYRNCGFGGEDIWWVLERDS